MDIKTTTYIRIKQEFRDVVNCIMENVDAKNINIQAAKTMTNSLSVLTKTYCECMGKNGFYYDIEDDLESLTNTVQKLMITYREKSKFKDYFNLVLINSELVRNIEMLKPQKMSYRYLFNEPEAISGKTQTETE